MTDNIFMAILSRIKKVSTKVDTVDSNVLVTQTNTAINNTASATGTLSQKLSHIITNLVGNTASTVGSTTTGNIMGKLNAILTKCNSSSSYSSVTSSTVLKTVVSSEKTSSYDPVYLGYCKVNGFSGQLTIKASLKGASKLYSDDSVNKAYLRIRYNDSENNHVTLSGSTQEYTTYSSNIYVADGDLIHFYLAGQRTGYGSYYCNLITICGTISEGVSSAKLS